MVLDVVEPSVVLLCNSVNPSLVAVILKAAPLVIRQLMNCYEHTGNCCVYLAVLLM